MTMRNLSVLIVSSFPPSFFAGLGDDMRKALEKIGCQVDFLTRYKFPYENVIGLERRKFKIKQTKITRLVLRCFRPFNSVFLKWGINKRDDSKYIKHDGRAIVAPNEEDLFYNNELVLNSIVKEYDFVIINVWQNMLTSITIDAIYKKLKVPILLLAGDMQPFTGGCYYFGNCRNFENGCGCCPILQSCDKYDLTYQNFKIKKNVYSNVNCAFVSNSYVNSFAKSSGMFERISYSSIPIDEDEYIPMNPKECRKYFNLPSCKKFVIFSRFVTISHKIKGYDYLLDSVNLFAKKLTEEQRNEVLLLFAGGRDEGYESHFDIDVKNIGLLSRKDLIKAYSAASVFVSSSIDEAGPSMLNQSMMCGTPVVSFDVGAAVDMTTNGVTGYKARMKDCEDLCSGLLFFYEQSEDQMTYIKKCCRERAMDNCALTNFANRIVNIYKSLIV